MISQLETMKDTKKFISDFDFGKDDVIYNMCKLLKDYWPTFALSFRETRNNYSSIAYQMVPNGEKIILALFILANATSEIPIDDLITVITKIGSRIMQEEPGIQLAHHS